MNFSDAFSPSNLKFLAEGFLVTLEVAFIAIILSFIVGCVVGTLRYTKLKVVSPILGVCVQIIRNLPLLLVLFFTFFALPEIGIKMGVFTSAVVALTIFEGAMIAEIVRSGLNSIPKGQIEAGRASGLSYTQTLWHIVLPQALRRMVPPLVSQFISLLKDTSLAVIISLPELMHNVQIVSAQHPNIVFPILILAAVAYFTVNYILSIISKRFESKFV
ncbi:amino acid ABC transporter permease [Paenibacillus beijingensis]|uniref:Glutamine ABC transporter permease n=1 Tax=Paenibacillus beijingensis TaxID=1126833 RepID=A0A0D5NNK7_9BACL|nr:amino acid ABC transporter permease [Paenibacillus beijingensis]AJY76725.1 glutamine ABC transporter permease [Paenibacillus beijingensis]